MGLAAGGWQFGNGCGIWPGADGLAVVHEGVRGGGGGSRAAAPAAVPGQWALQLAHRPATIFSAGGCVGGVSGRLCGVPPRASRTARAAPLAAPLPHAVPRSSERGGGGEEPGAAGGDAAWARHVRAVPVELQADARPLLGAAAAAQRPPHCARGPRLHPPPRRARHRGRLAATAALLPHPPLRPAIRLVGARAAALAAFSSAGRSITACTLQLWQGRVAGLQIDMQRSVRISARATEPVALGSPGSSMAAYRAAWSEDGPWRTRLGGARHHEEEDGRQVEQEVRRRGEQEMRRGAPRRIHEYSPHRAPLHDASTSTTVRRGWSLGTGAAKPVSSSSGSTRA
mmetsp:Transcript_33953/g.71305  ORF Transcript_33953/g.71305 Transcript_33953/m.71305 type:complete len:342 (+) Transcript_33953:2623-3648(+)